MKEVCTSCPATICFRSKNPSYFISYNKEAHKETLVKGNMEKCLGLISLAMMGVSSVKMFHNKNHQDNLQHLTGWYKGRYFREGVVQPKKK